MVLHLLYSDVVGCWITNFWKDCVVMLGERIVSSLVPRASITANTVEGLVKLLRRWRQVDVGRRGLSHGAYLALQFTGSVTPPNVHLTSFYVGVLPGLPPR